MDDLLKVRRISLSKNILRALEANQDIPPLQEYPRAHQVAADFSISFQQSDIESGDIQILFGHAEFPE